MRTFEEIQESIKHSKISTMQRSMQKLEKGGLESYEERAQNMIIKDCQDTLENLEEATIIEIGAVTNSLIERVQTAYKMYITDFWQNFERFADKYVIGLTPEGELKNGTYFGQSQCLELGIGVNELSCFKGRNPMSVETEDIFRKIINANYGTNIPMKAVEQQALQDYEAVAFGNDEIAKAQAFMHFKEIQRDSGALKSGGSYYLLSTDQNYQDAKAICSARSL